MRLSSFESLILNLVNEEYDDFQLYSGDTKKLIYNKRTMRSITDEILKYKK